jgi:hypothetical protein
MKPFRSSAKSFSAPCEDGPKRSSVSMTALIKQRSSIMPTVFDALYREYCRARLAEMRKQLLLVSTESNEVAEACDVGHPRDSAGRDSDFGDDRTYAS